MILRGCKLRNTEYVIGVSVFTGHDSKIMMNAQKAKYKFSSLESLSNRAILLVLATQVFFALIGGGVGTDWVFDYDEAIKNSKDKLPADYLLFDYVSKYVTDQPDYKKPENSNGGHEAPMILFIKASLTWVIIFTNLVPISLMV